MKSTRVMQLAALSVFSAVAISAFAGVGLASVSNRIAQPSHEVGLPNVIGGQSDRTRLGELQQQKIQNRTMLADNGCTPNVDCRFFGGNY